MNQYRVIRWPRKDAPSTFIYYKQYRVSDSLLSLPPSLKEDIHTLAPRTIQLMRFDQEFDSGMIERYFCRKLEQKARKIYTGSFKPKRSGVRKKRAQIYFALVVYSAEASIQFVLESTKLIQRLIEKQRGVRRNIALEVLQEIEKEVDLKDKTEREKQEAKDELVKQMETEGFEVVKPTKGGAHRKRAQGRTEGTVGVMDADFLQKHQLFEKASLARQMQQEGAASSFLGMRRGSADSDEMMLQNPDIWIKRKKKKKNKSRFKDFYKFQIKEQKKECKQLLDLELETLKRSFKAKKLKIEREEGG